MEIVDFTANKFLSILNQEQRNHMNEIIFVDDRSSMCIDDRNICFSFTDISFLEMLEIIYRLPNHIIFKINTDADGGSDMLSRCFNYDDDIGSVDLGNLIFRKRHVTHFYRHTRRLTELYLHCVDVNYVFWLYTFLSEMNITTLYLHNFSILKNENAVTRQYYILSRNCIDSARIRETVHFVLYDCENTQIRLKSATSDIGYPFYFQTTSFRTSINIKYISTLHIPNCDLTDEELIKICVSMYLLESLI